MRGSSDARLKHHALIVWSGSRLLTVRFPGCTSLPAPVIVQTCFCTATHGFGHVRGCAAADRARRCGMLSALPEGPRAPISSIRMSIPGLRRGRRFHGAEALSMTCAAHPYASAHASAPCIAAARHSFFRLKVPGPAGPAPTAFVADIAGTDAPPRRSPSSTEGKAKPTGDPSDGGLGG